MQTVDIFSKDTLSLDTSSSLLNSQKDEKSSPSLFDSLLSGMNLNEDSNTNVEISSSNLNISKTASSGMENIMATVGTGSLLDKLVLDAKELIVENKLSTQSLDSKIVKQNVKPDVEQNIEGKAKFVDTLKELISNENVTNNLGEDLKVQNKSENSLLDKLVLDVQKDISVEDLKTSLTKNKQAITQENSILKEGIVTNLSNKEDLLLDLPTDTQNITTDLAKDIKNIVIVKDNSENLLADKQILNQLSDNKPLDTSLNATQVVVDSSEVKIEKKVDDLKKGENVVTSLLDKLILDAKNIIIEDKNSLKDKKIDNKSQTVEVTENKENLSILSTENSNIINDVDNRITTEQKVADIKPNLEVLVQNSKTSESVDNVAEQKVEDKPKSLMDALIQNSIKKQEEFASKNVDLTSTDLKSKDVLSNIYLSEQKNQLNTQLNFNKAEALKLLKDGASLEDIKKGASILDLGLDNIDVEKTISLDELTKKSSLRDLQDRKNILDSLLNEKNIRTVDVRNLITKSVEASAALIDNTINIQDDKVVNVNSPLSFNIQTKIIGARQQMSNMMSDIARQMYENYKPPVTVFRINLNPEHLGSISIMMKNDRNSDVSITMSVTSQATLDALVENQNLLRNSLVKSFDENTKFNLDFSSGEKNQEQSNQQKQEERRNQDEHIDTQTILKLQEDNKEIDDKFDYM